MERLTKRVGDGEATPICDFNICTPFEKSGLCKTGMQGGPFGRWERHCNDLCILGRMIDRLAAYEDTGLDPLEIETLKTGTCLGCSVPESKAHYEQIRKWEDADSEGRLVVLPCKVGDTAWVKDRAGVPREMRLETADIRFVCTDEDNLCMATCHRKPDGFCAYRIRNDGTDIGKTVFLTREEAERAIAGGSDHA